MKPSEKFKSVFKFDWDKNEDTSVAESSIRRDIPTVYQGFGKSLIVSWLCEIKAGIDQGYQKKNNKYNSELSKLRQKVKYFI